MSWNVNMRNILTLCLTSLVPAYWGIGEVRSFEGSTNHDFTKKNRGTFSEGDVENKGMLQQKPIATIACKGNLPSDLDDLEGGWHRNLEEMMMMMMMMMMMIMNHDDDQDFT